MRASAVDAVAADASSRRLARGKGAPWLHVEVARRMAERLELVRTVPEVLVDWGAFIGGGAKLLASAYPRARRIVVEPHSALRERSMRDAHAPWWSSRRWTAPATEVIDDPHLPDGVAQLLWSNMALHTAADPLEWLRRWRRLIAVDGFLMFSTLGPDTVAALRELYSASGWPPPAQVFIDMHDWGDMLVAAGFADPVMDQEHLTLTWADACVGARRTARARRQPASAAVCRPAYAGLACAIAGRAEPPSRRTRPHRARLRDRLWPRVRRGAAARRRAAHRSAGRCAARDGAAPPRLKGAAHAALEFAAWASSCPLRGDATQ